MSAIELIRSWGVPVTERKLAVDEIAQAVESGHLDEAFGTGTAAVVSPIGELKYCGKVMPINGGKIGPISQKLYDVLTGIQFGKLEDPFGWVVEI